MMTTAFTLWLLVKPPLDLTEEEQEKAQEMIQEYKNDAHCRIGVLAIISLGKSNDDVLSPGKDKVIHLECIQGVVV